MFHFSPSVSMALHLKNHISSAICEVICLLKNLMLSDSDDYLFYKLEQAIYLRFFSQNIWPHFFTDEIIQILLTDHNSLSQENTEKQFIPG